jgi:hypothetical protein
MEDLWDEKDFDCERPVANVSPRKKLVAPCGAAKRVPQKHDTIQGPPSPPDELPDDGDWRSRPSTVIKISIGPHGQPFVKNSLSFQSLASSVGDGNKTGEHCHEEARENRSERKHKAKPKRKKKKKKNRDEARALKLYEKSTCAGTVMNCSDSDPLELDPSGLNDSAQVSF